MLFTEMKVKWFNVKWRIASFRGAKTSNVQSWEDLSVKYWVPAAERIRSFSQMCFCCGDAASL